jgi:hypothetical protein
MKFEDIESMIYIDNHVIIDGVEMTINTPLSNMKAVQYLSGRDFIIEEPSMNKVPLEEYQYVLDEYVEAKELVDNPIVSELTLEEKIQMAISLLKNNINYESPTECLNINWVGGYESAQMLNAKRTLCLEMGLESCTFTDSVDADHVLTLIEAKEVCIKVAQEFEERRAAYKAKKRAIEACTTIEELEAILL